MEHRPHRKRSILASKLPNKTMEPTIGPICNPNELRPSTLDRRRTGTCALVAYIGRVVAARRQIYL